MARGPLAFSVYGPQMTLRKDASGHSGKGGTACSGLPSEPQISPYCSLTK